MPTNDDDMRAATRSLMTDLNRRFGRGSLMLAADGGEHDHASTSSGIESLDEALGVRGYPHGRIVEVYGPEHSGKRTMCLHAIAASQRAERAGRVAPEVALVDIEGDFDPGYARALGVNLAKLLLSQPDSGEQAMEIVTSLARAGVPLIVVDSVGAIVPQAVIDGEAPEQAAGLQARLMSKSLRQLTAVCSRTGTTVIFINHLRQRIGAVFGNPCSTPGGNALKFYASVRLDVRRTGERMRVKVVKNKCAPPFQVAHMTVDSGIQSADPED